MVLSGRKQVLVFALLFGRLFALTGSISRLHESSNGQRSLRPEAPFFVFQLRSNPEPRALNPKP